MEAKVGPLTEEQVNGLVALLKDPTVKDRLADAAQQKLKMQTASMDPASTRTGEKLFHGSLAFANGGMACAACHTAGFQGGSMGPDLTSAFTRLGASGIQSAAEQANFKVMKAAYKDHAVLPQEAVHLTAYLETVASKPGTGSVPNIPLIGSIGAALMLSGLGFAYRKKNGGSARAKLIRRR
jgi:cytochrome c2